MDFSFPNVVGMFDREADLIISDYEDNVMLVTGISKRGRDVVALVQEHGAIAQGNSQCIVHADALQRAYRIHRGLRITEIAPSRQ